MAESKGPVVREQVWLALLLPLVGGYVDAVGYLLLFKMFTAHMSGNSIAMTVEIGKGDWSQAFHRAFPIPVFVFGVVLGAVLMEALHRRGWRAALTAALGLEALLLGLFMAFGAAAYHDGELRPDNVSVFYLLAALPAVAMGLQNSALRRVGGLGVSTTYITGMLTNFAEDAVVYAYWLRDQIGRGGSGILVVLAQSPSQRSFHSSFLYLSICAAYVVGGVAGAFAELQWRTWSLSGPTVVLVCVAVGDLIRPLVPQKMEWKP